LDRREHVCAHLCGHAVEERQRGGNTIVAVAVAVAAAAAAVVAAHEHARQRRVALAGHRVPAARERVERGARALHVADERTRVQHDEKGGERRRAPRFRRRALQTNKVLDNGVDVATRQCEAHPLDNTTRVTIIRNV
jgi:hypothetical protein